MITYGTLNVVDSVKTEVNALFATDTHPTSMNGTWKLPKVCFKNMKKHNNKKLFMLYTKLPIDFF